MKRVRVVTWGTSHCSHRRVTPLLSEWFYQVLSFVCLFVLFCYFSGPLHPHCHVSQQYHIMVFNILSVSLSFHTEHVSVFSGVFNGPSPRSTLKCFRSLFNNSYTSFLIFFCTNFFISYYCHRVLYSLWLFLLLYIFLGFSVIPQLFIVLILNF